jgi:hypothetical protein
VKHHSLLCSKDYLQAEDTAEAVASLLQAVGLQLVGNGAEVSERDPEMQDRYWDFQTSGVFVRLDLVFSKWEGKNPHHGFLSAQVFR